MATRRSRSGKPVLRPDDIIDAAVELTERVGLDGWSVRDVARPLGASLSSIYHHVGGKDELARRVVERVLDGFSLPPDDLEWREWFTAMLVPARERLLRYPGVAHWMLMHGPIFNHSMQGLDSAIAMLQRAGFEHRAGLVFATIFNAALANIATADARRHHTDDAPRDHAAIMRQLQERSTGSPGGHTIMRTVTPFTQDEKTAAAAAAVHYEFLLTSLLNGINLTAEPGVQGIPQGVC